MPSTGYPFHSPSPNGLWFALFLSLTGYAWGGVAGRLFDLSSKETGVHVFGGAVPGLIERGARSAMDKAKHSPWLVGLSENPPSAKSSPVYSELIRVHDGAINRDVGFSGAERIKFSRVQRSRYGLLRVPVEQFGRIFGMFGRKDKPSEHPGVSFGDRKKRWFILALYNLNHRIGSNPQGRTFSNVGEFDRDRYGRRRSFETGVVHFYPSPLVRSEIIAQVLPLTVRHNCVSNSSKKAEYLQRALEPNSFPPWKGYSLGVLAIISVAWGWRHDSRGWAVILGAFLWAWALLIILPTVARA